MFYPSVGHVIPVAPYSAIISGHAGVPGQHPVPQSAASSTLTELLAPSVVLTQQQGRELGGGGGGKMIDMGSQPFSPGQHQAGLVRHSSSGK